MGVPLVRGRRIVKVPAAPPPRGGAQPPPPPAVKQTMPVPRREATPPGTGATVPLSSRAGAAIKAGIRTSGPVLLRTGAGVGLAAAGVGLGVGLVEGVPQGLGGRGPIQELVNPFQQPGTPGGPALPGTEGGRPLSFLESLFGTTQEGQPNVKGSTILLLGLAAAAVFLATRMRKKEAKA